MYPIHPPSHQKRSHSVHAVLQVTLQSTASCFDYLAPLVEHLTFSWLSSPSSLVWSAFLLRQLVAPAVSSLYLNPTVVHLCMAGTQAYFDAPRPRLPLQTVHPCLRQPIIGGQDRRISPTQVNAQEISWVATLPFLIDGLRHQTTAMQHLSAFSSNSNPSKGPNGEGVSSLLVSCQ